MITAVDSSVIIDVLVDDASHAHLSLEALRRARREGALVVGETVLAEVTPVLPKGEVRLFLSEWDLRFVPSSAESAILAGEMARQFWARGGRRGRVMADFLIGAHAQCHAERLLTRDRGFYRDYFKDLTLLQPA